jgi:hypothetical protein
MTTVDVTTEILQQIRADIREVRAEMKEGFKDLKIRMDALEARMDGLDSRMAVVEFAIRGMATSLGELVGVVSSHGRRLDRLERDH